MTSRVHRAAAAATAALVLGACQSVASRHDDVVDATQAELASRVGDARFDPAAEVRSLLQDGLTEDEAVRIALANNGAVRAAFARLGIATAELVQAGLLRNPVFSAQGAFVFTGGTEWEINLTQPFVDLFFRPLRERVAERELAAAQALVLAELVQLCAEVRRAFVQVRASQQLVELQQQAVAAATASHELMQRLHGAGNVTDPQRTAERLGEARARLELAAAERAVREAREPLNALLGVFGGDVGWRVDGRLEPGALDGLELDDVEARAVAQSLVLRGQRARIEAAAQSAELQRWPWLADDTFGLAALREPGGDWGLGPALSVELPLFDQGDATRHKALAVVEQRLHEHAQTAVEVRSAARLLHTRAAFLAERAAFLRDEYLPSTSRLVRETVQNYNAMQIGAFEVLQQKQQQLTAARDYLDTLRELWLVRIDLDELLAGAVPAAAQQPFWPGGGDAAAGRRRVHG